MLQGSLSLQSHLVTTWMCQSSVRSAIQPRCGRLTDGSISEQIPGTYPLVLKQENLDKFNHSSHCFPHICRLLINELVN